MLAVACYQLYFCMLTILISGLHLIMRCKSLVNVCVTELNFLDMATNTTKSSCLRYGRRHKNDCACGLWICCDQGGLPK